METFNDKLHIKHSPILYQEGDLQQSAHPVAS